VYITISGKANATALGPPAPDRQSAWIAWLVWGRGIACIGVTFVVPWWHGRKLRQVVLTETRADNAKAAQPNPADPKARRRCMYVADFDNAYDCHLGWYFGQAYGYVMYLICKGPATQGEFAAVRDYKGAGEQSLLPYRTPGPWKDEFRKKQPGMYEQYAAHGPEFARYMDSVLEWAHDESQLSARE
jgi:hypothetical protein